MTALSRSVVEPDLERVYYGKDKGTTKQRTGSCSGCGKKRKLYLRPFTALASTERYKYGGYCSECVALTVPELEAVIAAKRAAKAAKPREARFAYPCIGGPLDGEYATTDDFYTESGTPGERWHRPGGMYGHLGREYLSYNASGGGGPRRKGNPSMVFIHTSCLKPLVRPRDR